MNSNGYFASIRNLWRRPTPSEVAARELAEAELSRLQQQSAAEWAAAMVGYQDTKIQRLRAFLKARNEEQP